MGDGIAAAAVQLRPHSSRDPSRAAVGRARGATGCQRTQRRTPRNPCKHAERCAAANPRSLAAAVDLAAHGGHCHHRLLHRIDLHALGGRVGNAAHRRHADCLVLAEGHQRGRGMKERLVEDVSTLPAHGFGSATTPWWGTLAFVAIEGAGFALAIGAYLYLYVVNPDWPLSALPPNHWPATMLTLLLLASLWANQRADTVARSLDLRRVRTLLVIMSVVGLVALAIRGYEFANLNVRWDANAYGSILWFILGLHTTHLATDVGDTVVLTVLMFTRHATERRFSD